MLPEQTETKSQIPEEERLKIVRLMKRVSRRSLLRRVIDGKTGAISSSSESASNLICLLNTTPETKWRERLVAAMALRYVPIAPEEESAAAQALGRTLQTEYMGRIAAATIRMGLCSLTAIASIIVSALLYDSSGLLLRIGYAFCIASGLLMLATPVVCFMSPLWDTVVNEEVQIAAIRTMNHLHLAESVGALAKAAYGQKCFSRGAHQALIQLLPTLIEAHYGRLPNDATPELCALLLDSDTSEHLIMLTVEAIGKVGDGRAVEPMQTFAQTARTPKLREMAETILPILTARREQENASTTLLRHSSAPPIAASQLLRAASASAATPPEQLLRPSAGTDATPDAEN